MINPEPDDATAADSRALNPFASLPTAETEIILVRHGQTVGNTQRLMQGWLPVPLDELGEQQSRLVADRIARDCSPDAIVTSPLIRAMQTAGTIGAAVGITPTIHDGFREIHPGTYQGMPFDDFAREHPEFVRILNDDENLDLTWPGGESRRDLLRRVTTALSDTLRSFSGQRVVIVSHGGVIGSLLAIAAGDAPFAREHRRVANASLSRLIVDRHGIRVYSRNNTDHLAGISTTS